MSTQSKRMGGLGKLSDFGRTSQPEPPMQPEPKPIRPLDPQPINSKQDQLVTINIKISRSQQDWLANTARNI